MTDAQVDAEQKETRKNAPNEKFLARILICTPRAHLSPVAYHARQPANQHNRSRSSPTILGRGEVAGVPPLVRPLLPVLHMMNKPHQSAVSDDSPRNNAAPCAQRLRATASDSAHHLTAYIEQLLMPRRCLGTHTSGRPSAPTASCPQERRRKAVDQQNV
uniref:Uncharacterized protein n=1 Tax=Plectus sambesii TaxID=2011161 RepID=A0A914WAL7_9BILA